MIATAESATAARGASMGFTLEVDEDESAPAEGAPAPAEQAASSESPASVAAESPAQAQREPLPTSSSATLLTLEAEHSSRHVFGRAAAPGDGGDGEDGREALFNNPDAATQDAVHPVVIEHPLSGRPALYVNLGFTIKFVGWTNEESQPLLDYLYRHAARHEFTCRFHWQPGSVAIWDNRAVHHNALNDYHGQRRLMHRITIEGEKLSRYRPAAA